VQAASADMSWKAIERNSKDYIELKKAKRQLLQDARRHPACAAGAWDKVIAKKAGENPLFKKVLDSQKAFAQRAGQWQNDYTVDFKMAYNHYFAARRPDRATPERRRQAPFRGPPLLQGRWPLFSPGSRSPLNENNGAAPLDRP
jgi:hypothetical protein